MIFETEMECIMIPWAEKHKVEERSVFAYRRLLEVETIKEGDLFTLVDEDYTYLMTPIGDSVDSLMNALSICIKEANSRGQTLAVPDLGVQDWSIMKDAYNGLLIQHMENAYDLIGPIPH